MAAEKHTYKYIKSMAELHTNFAVSLLVLGEELPTSASFDGLGPIPVGMQVAMGVPSQ